MCWECIRPNLDHGISPYPWPDISRGQELELVCYIQDTHAGEIVHVNSHVGLRTTRFSQLLGQTSIAFAINFHWGDELLNIKSYCEDDCVELGPYTICAGPHGQSPQGIARHYLDEDSQNNSGQKYDTCNL